VGALGGGVKALHTNKVAPFFIYPDLICGKVKIFIKKRMQVLLATVL